MGIEASLLVSGKKRLVSSAALNEAARLASILKTRGIGENDVVALLMWNDTPFFTLAEACRLVGAYLVPLNWHLAPPEIAYILDDCDAKLLVGHAPLLRDAGIGNPGRYAVLAREVPDWIAAAYPRVPPFSRDAWPGGWEDWAELLATHEPYTGPTPNTERGGVFYTSGTTGKPKGVVRSPLPPTVWAELNGRSRKAFGLPESDDSRCVTVTTGPLYHSAPNAYAQQVWRRGGTVIMAPRFDAEALLQTIQDERVTHLHLVPTMMKRLLDLPKEVRERWNLSSLVSLCHGAAPCPPEVKRGAIEWFGPIVNEYYAGTETGIVAWSSSADWLARPGTVGFAARGVDIRVINEHGQELPAGETGELIARSSSTTSFNYHNRSGSVSVAGWDGYVSLGDIGRLDADGYIFLSDRRSDMIISGGVNIYPAEIEAEISALPGVKDCIVFGVPDSEFGEAVYAIVEPLPGQTPDPTALLASLRPRLAAYKLPRAIELRAELPREDSGKIRKRLIREEFWKNTGRRI